MNLCADRKIKSAREFWRLFLCGAVIGALIFAAIYGVKILSFTYDGWLLCGDMDLRQHYLGWCHYRYGELGFPLGMIQTLSYPNSMSVIYTDSIPLVAVVFKLFSGILPETFQYFGLYGLLSFALTGAFGSVLLKTFLKKEWQVYIALPLLVASFPILQRMYYHTALASHYLIMAAFVIALYAVFDRWSVIKTSLVWALMGFMCVGIHSYFLPMIGLIMLASLVWNIMESHEKSAVWTLICSIVSFCTAALLALFIFGGFAGPNSAAGGGLGVFNSNLNTFINPLDMGLLPGLSTFGDFQYEGFAYLGLGIISGALLVLIFCICTGKWRHIHMSPMGKVTCAMFVISAFISIFPMFSIGGVKIVWFPIPDALSSVLGIFRSNGRFIWVAMYIIMIAVIVAASRLSDRTVWSAIIMCGILLVQGIDLSKLCVQKSDYFRSNHTYDSLWDEIEESKITKDKDCFVFLYNDSDIVMDTAYYAYHHGMYQNNFYYARDIDKAIETEIAMYTSEILSGKLREEAVYVLRQQDLPEWDEVLSTLPIRRMDYKDHVIFVKNRGKEQN